MTQSPKANTTHLRPADLNSHCLAYRLVIDSARNSSSSWLNPQPPAVLEAGDCTTARRRFTWRLRGSARDPAPIWPGSRC